MTKQKNKILTSLIALMSLLSVALLWRENFVLTLVLILLGTFMLLMNKSVRELKTFIFCGIMGAMAESFGIFSGVWVYSNPNLLNFPVWLIFLWGIASVFMVRIYFFFKD